MSESTTPAAAPSAFVAAERRRRAGLKKALQWYTAPERGLTITPIHFPLPQEPAEEGGPVVAGRCSCGGYYRVDESGVVAKPETPEEAAKACTSPGKHPYMRHYVSDPNAQATTAERALELWGDKPWNVGVIHGQTTGVVVFDVDVRANGLSSMTTLSTKLGEVTGDWALTNTLSYHTSGSRGRGFHLYFRVDRDDLQMWRDLRQMGEVILPGIEVKWKSGMVVAAPSLHASGQAYQISNNVPIAVLDRTKLAHLRQALALANGKSPAATTAPASTGGAMNWAAMAAAAENYASTTGAAYGGDVSWEQAPQDDPANAGYWSRQLTHLLMTGRPARQFGPGEHHDSLKPLIGALAKIIFSKDTFCREVAQAANSRSQSDPLWVPALFGSLVYEIDAAVTVPRPWQQTDPHNLHGIARYAMTQELRAHGLDV